MRIFISLCYLFLCCFFSNLNAQQSFATIEAYQNYYDEIFDLQENANRQQQLLEKIEYLLDHPLEINHKLEPLVDLQLISDKELMLIKNYKAKHGAFVSIYELQAIEGISPDALLRIQHLIKSDHTGAKESLIHKIKHSSQSVFMRWSRTLETKKGYKKDSLGSSTYIGDPNAYYIRYRGHYNKKISYGLTLEKDPGEQFYKQSSIFGFDHYSFHFQLQSSKSIFRKVIIGDFTYRMGQGIILNNGFSTGKGIHIGNIKMTGQPLKSFTALSESLYFRGLATQLYLGKHLSANVFLSRRNQDASLDSTAQYFSSILLSGLHRTEGEIQQKHAIQMTSAGGSIAFRKKRNSIRLNSIYHSFSKPLVRSDDLYKKYLFQGKWLWNQSLDYNFIFKNLHWFGEVARDHQGHISTNSGLMMAWNRFFSFGLHYRNYHSKFQNLFANAFSESSNPQNEKGMYLSIAWNPIKNVSVNAYIDAWKHPWYKFNIDGPSDGTEYIVRFSYKKKRKLLFYGQYKKELKGQNLKVENQKLIRTRNKSQYRFHMAYYLQRQIQFRSRLEISTLNFEETKEAGYLMYQDFIYKPIGTNLSFTSRLAYFDIPSYGSRIYAYENDILGSFSIPAYQGQGIRFYLNVRYRPLHHLTLDFRIAHTNLYFTEEISSGPEQINGNTKTQVKAQMKIRF